MDGTLGIDRSAALLGTANADFDFDFEKATTAKALQNPVQSEAASDGSEKFGGEEISGDCEFAEKEGAKEYARRDSNPQPLVPKTSALSD